MAGLTALNGVRSVILSWDLHDVNFMSVGVWRSETNDRTTAAKIQDVVGGSFVDSTVLAGTTYYYWILSSYNALLWEPLGPTAGVEITADWADTPDIKLAAVNDLTILTDTSDVNTPADYMVQAKGTITMLGVSVADETFEIDGETFTWKAIRVNPFEVTIGANAPAAVTNIVTAIAADMATVTAVDGAGDTVVVTVEEYGWHGNTYTFSEDSTNMSMDGSGFLGGTVDGWTNYEELEHIDIVGAGYPVLLTASDVFSYGYSIGVSEEIRIEYFVGLWNDTTSTWIVTYTLAPILVFRDAGGTNFVVWAFLPYIRTIQTLTDGQNYIWVMEWAKKRTGTSTCQGLSQDRILTAQEIKR